MMSATIDIADLLRRCRAVIEGQGWSDLERDIAVALAVPADLSVPTILPDGSAFGVLSFPLPKDHWLYADREYEDGADEPKDLPAPILTHEQRSAVTAAVRYAVRAATDCGKLEDFDPDALVQNAVYALCGPGITINLTPPEPSTVGELPDELSKSAAGLEPAHLAYLALAEVKSWNCSYTTGQKLRLAIAAMRGDTCSNGLAVSRALEDCTAWASGNVRDSDIAKAKEAVRVGMAITERIIAERGLLSVPECGLMYQGSPYKTPKNFSFSDSITHVHSCMARQFELNKTTSHDIHRGNVVLFRPLYTPAQMDAHALAAIAADRARRVWGDERKAFEAWAKRYGHDLTQHPLRAFGGLLTYQDSGTDFAWDAWQARAALDKPATDKESLTVQADCVADKDIIKLALHRLVSDAYSRAFEAGQDRAGRFFKPGDAAKYLDDAKRAELALIEIDKPAPDAAALVEAARRVCSHGARPSSQIDADWDALRAALRAYDQQTGGV